MVACNVAEVIFSELSDDNIAFRNPVYNKIMAAYREQWAQLGTGVEVPAHVFLNHIDPEVCNMSVDILTSDDNYVASELWRRKEIHIDTDAEMLAVGVLQVEGDRGADQGVAGPAGRREHFRRGDARRGAAAYGLQSGQSNDCK